MIDLTPLANVLIVLLASIITVWVIPLIKSKTSAAQQESIKRWVNIAVTAAEQIYGSGNGVNKKAYVVDFLKSKGFSLNTDEIDSLIESSVYNILNSNSTTASTTTTSSTNTQN